MSQGRPSKNSKGLLNFSKAYHFIRQEINEAIQDLRISFKVPTAKVIGSNSPGDNQTKISTFRDNSTFDNMKPSSMHFVSSPVEKEVVPIFEFGNDSFYGQPLPIYDSLTNTAQLIPKDSPDFNPDLSVSPIQITPGDVVVQGRYGHAMVFSDNFSRPTLRIGNSFRSRDPFDVDLFNTSEFASKLNIAQTADPSIPNFFDPNVDGGSIYLLRNTAPGIDLETEAMLNGEERISTYNKKVLSAPAGGTFQQNRNVNNKMLLSSDNIFIYTKGANYRNHDINVLSSGNLTLNSMNNIFITTPAVDEKSVSGIIYIGTSENRGLTPNATMQPAVRGLNYLSTMCGIAKANDTRSSKIGEESVLGILKQIITGLERVANGGLSVDGDGTSNSDIAAFSNAVKDSIDSLHSKILGKAVEVQVDGKSVTKWTGDVSKKVFVE